MSSDQLQGSSTVSSKKDNPMNLSNAYFERDPGKVERNMDETQARNEEGLKVAAVVKKSSGTQLTAASALTSLKPAGADENEDFDEEEQEGDFKIPLRFTKSGRKRATPFPMKLMKVLSIKRHSHIISWTPDGRGFNITRPKQFANELLTKYFKEAKFASFTRKLHRWGFQRHLRGSDTGSYYHKYFVQGRLDLLDQMTCYKPREHNPVFDFQTPQSVQEALLQQQFLMMQAAQQRAQMMPSQEMIQQAEEIKRRQLLAQWQAQQAPPKQQQQQLQQAPSESQEQREQQGVSEERMNAAIEAEVSRRIQERIQAASMSRQAIGMLQQQRDQEQPSPFAEMAPAPAFVPQQAQVDMGMFDKNAFASRVQDAAQLRLAASRGFDPSPQQFFPPNFEGPRGS